MFLWQINNKHLKIKLLLHEIPKFAEHITNQINLTI